MRDPEQREPLRLIRPGTSEDELARIRSSRNEVVPVLEELLALAKTGAIDEIAIIYHRQPGAVIGTSLTTVHNAFEFLGALAMMQQQIIERIQRPHSTPLPPAG